MSNLFARFSQDESGATAIEYGLIAAFIAVALISVLGGVKSALQGTFSSIASGLNTATGS